MPLDAWSLHVHDVATVEPRVEVFAREPPKRHGPDASSKVRLGPSPLWRSQANIEAQVCLRDRCLQFSELEVAWGLEEGIRWPCLWVPDPILELLVKGRFPVLLLCWSWARTQWNDLGLPLPSPDWIRHVGMKLGKFSKPRATDLSINLVAFLARIIRSCQQQLAASSSSLQRYDSATAVSNSQQQLACIVSNSSQQQ